MPISSRKIVPPSASANLPFLVVVAPVKAPRTWPNSSDSSSVSGMAAQLTLMSGMSRCALRSWMARATSSLPVPVSPVMSTVLFVSRDQLGAADHVLHRAAAPDDAVVVELLVALVDAGSGTRCAAAGARARAGRRPAARRSRTASAGSRARRASSPRSRSRPWRAPSSSGSAGARPPGVDATYSRISSRPVSSGMTLSTMSTSNGRSASSRCACARARRLDDVVAGVAQRAAERLENLLFVVDEEDRAAVGECHAVPVCEAARSTDLGAAPGALDDGDRAAQPLDDVLGDRQPEAGAAALGREVRIEDAAPGRRADAGAAVGDGDAPRVPPSRRAVRQRDARADRVVARRAVGRVAAR